MSLLRATWQRKRRRPNVADLLPFPPIAEELEPHPLIPSQPEPAKAPPDAAARAQALDIRRSFIVEAPAGSGKTGLLIQRFLKLLADGMVTSPEQVLAITFTLKATSELRDRVLEHLESAAKATPVTGDFEMHSRTLAHAVLERDRQLGWSLLDHPHRLNIRTIDSVCAEIARSLPVVSGSGGRLAPANDARPLHREAARRTLLLLGGSDAALDAALRDLLLHRDGNLADCETLIAEMLALREQWGALVPLTPSTLDDAWLDAKVLPSLQAALEKAICSELTHLCAAIDSSMLADLTELATQMAHLDGYKGQPSPIALCHGRSQPPAAAAKDLDHWRALIHLLVKPSKPRSWRKSVARNSIRFEIEKHHESQLKRIIARFSDSPGLIEILCRIDSLPEARYPANQWAVAKSLFRVLNRALIELQLVFAARGQCDFTELSLLARAALNADSGPEDLAAASGARLQHLLVDEMQDTSAAQYDLIHLLTASWDGHSQTVFLVGDPRQSIYLFRQARVERFLETLHTQRLGDLPLTRLRLTANFRSQQTLVEHFNHDFGRIFPHQAAAQNLPYNDADSTLPPSTHSSGLNWHANVVHIHPEETLPAAQAQPLLNLTPAQLRQRQATQNAREMVRIARHWLSKPLPANRARSSDGTPKPWEIAVLVRSRSHLAEIVTAFEKSRIPYRAVEITPLNERQEILDLTALTRALLHPADRVAWLAILRAPWCGLSLPDLHILTGSDDASLKDQSIQRLIADRGHMLGEESIQRLQRVWQVLSAATAQRARLSTAQLVERTWRSLGGDSWLAEPERNNARRFFQLLDEMETELGSSGRIDPALLNDRQQRLYAEPIHIPPGHPFVELLTIHNAKGLERDVVLVPALERSPGINRARLLTWSEINVGSSEEGVAPVMLAPIAAKGEEVDTLTRWLKGIHREREAAERKRLFYVASTRAREELHLFAAPDFSSIGEVRTRHDSLLNAAWPAAQTPFARAKQDAAEMPATHRATASGPRVAIESPAFDLAASAAPASAAIAQPTLRRLPLTFNAAARFGKAQAEKLAYGDRQGDGVPSKVQFSRPEGSFAARTFGNAVHASLETFAHRILNGATPASLLAELPNWNSRIAAMLRADGLPPTTVERLTRDTRAALENALCDRDGLWLLGSHPGAASEFAITAWGAPQDIASQSHPKSVRVDRIFHAGAEPRAEGDNFLWIVDYKTSGHGPGGLEDFLATQRLAYAPQLEAYAHILGQARSKSLHEIRVALYFPAIPRLIWWKPSEPDQAT
jgi:ATP-dependent helicase/nuclease subunit A